jgi:hypothetical protein
MLVALGHHPVTSHLPIACEQEADLLQRLLFVISRVPIRLASVAHEGTPPSSGTGRPTLRSHAPAVELAASAARSSAGTFARCDRASLIVTSNKKAGVRRCFLQWRALPSTWTPQCLQGRDLSLLHAIGRWNFVWDLAPTRGA